jgi:hypothetical protein
VERRKPSFNVSSFLFFLFFLSLFFLFFFRSFGIWYNFSLQSLMLKEETSSPRFRRLAKFQRNPWIVGAKAQLVYFLVVAVPSILSGVGVYHSIPDPAKTCWAQSAFGLALAQAIIGIFILIWIIYNLWAVGDAYLIKLELTIVLFVGVPLLIVWAIAITFNWSGGPGAGFWVDVLEVR